MPVGGVASVGRRRPFCKLSVCLSVDADEIKRLGKRFKKLDLDNSGSLSVEEFMSLPELQQNPLVQRVIDIFDTDGNGEVDFKGERARPPLLSLGDGPGLTCCLSCPPEFIEGVSQFSVKGDKEQKLRCECPTSCNVHSSDLRTGSRITSPFIAEI